ncbi:MAG: CoB--CoM heterodisulfide reductase iron-sulfur subunit A family protein [Armatimonadota bacterium]
MSVKIGVYVCHCGSNISQTVDVEDAVKYASTLPGVVVAKEYKYMCSDPGQDIIKKDVKEKGINRVVVAACSPLMHEPTFKAALAQSGLNPYYLQMANIREHCSWVTDDKVKATEKAKALINAAVRRLVHHEALESRQVDVIPKAIVIGGGIAGIEAALKLANAGKKVILVEKSPSIGGHMAQFDKTFPTLDCSACILTPKMVEVGRNPNITLMSWSEVVEVSGSVGNFKVKIKKKPRYIDESKCISCQLCVGKCPVKVSSEFEAGLGTRGAIYTPFAQAVPAIPVIDKENCTYFKTEKCQVCAKLCPVDAVDYNQEEKIIEEEAGAIIIATGFELFDCKRIPQFGYGRLDNVLTSLEFERMLNASGPTNGKIVMKDGRTPKTVAIIHCVGSRDENYNEHCSRVCCMYAVKYAHLLKDKLDADVYNMYIDLRCFGKGYEEFYGRVLEEGVVFIRGRAAEVSCEPLSDTEEGKLIVKVEDTLLARTRRMPVDMVILCAGLEPSSGTKELLKSITCSSSKDGFILEKHPKLAPVSTATDGIFVAGCCQGPKDIPDSVAQGAAAAAEALVLIDKGKVDIEPITAVIDEDKCSGCRICNNLCPYSAIEFDQEKKVSKVNETLCKGCGTCVAACPIGAIKGRHFTDSAIHAEIEGILI